MLWPWTYKWTWNPWGLLASVSTFKIVKLGRDWETGLETLLQEVCINKHIYIDPLSIFILIPVVELSIKKNIKNLWEQHISRGHGRNPQLVSGPSLNPFEDGQHRGKQSILLSRCNSRITGSEWWFPFFNGVLSSHLRDMLVWGNHPCATGKQEAMPCYDLT